MAESFTYIAELGETLVKSTSYEQRLSEIYIDPLGRLDDRRYMFVEAEPHVNVRYRKD